jgi:tRNA-dihydrouridine synthase B
MTNQQTKLLGALQQNPFILAPMAGITDHPFRSFMKKMGAGIVVTELVSATGLEYKSKKTRGLMSFDESQRPVGIQLFGEQPEHVAHAAKLVEEMGADFVDLNFGCPVPKVVKKGAGSALLKDLPALTAMLRAAVGAVKIPVTIKIRTGWDAHTRNAHEVCEIAYNEGITWVAIHGRTRAQSYEGFSDWDYIASVKATAKLPIIGNGDVVTARQALLRQAQSGVDGVMIGRGALKNPYIFFEAQGLPVNRDYAQLIQDLYEFYRQHCDDYITQIQLKKFAAWFATGFPGAAQFRKNIYQTSTTSEIISFAKSYFALIEVVRQEESSHEGFLMGGHG